jgi:hypothetical protein
MIIKKIVGSFLLCVFLLYIVFLTIKPLPRSGYYPVHDDQQVIRLQQVDKCIHDLQIPCRWVPDMGYGYGYPQFNYYAPLPYYVMEVFHLLGFGFLSSIKIYLVFISLLTIWGMYKLSAKFWQNRFAGYLSALFYTLLPYRAVNLYVRGAVGEYTAQALIPLILFYGLCLIKEKSKSSILYFSLVLSFLFLSHNISGLFFMPFLAVWIIYNLFRGSRTNIVVVMKKIIFAFTGGIVLSAFFFLPAFFERGFVHLETLTSNYFDFRGHFLSIKQILFSSSWGYGSSLPGDNDQIMLGVGILFWFIPLVTMIFAFIVKRRRMDLISINLLAWISLFLTHPKSIFIWDYVPFMKYVQFPWRLNVFAAIFFCLALGYLGFMIINKSVRLLLVIAFSVVLLIFYGRFFRPDKWMNITDTEKLSGKNWELAQTVSINDYLPIYTSLSPTKQAQMDPVTLSGNVNYISVEKGTNWQRWKVEATQDSLIQAQIFYFPQWKVYVDKNEVMFNYENNNGLITFNIEKGMHEVIIKLMDTPARIFGNLITILGFPLFLFIYKRYKYEG